MRRLARIVLALALVLIAESPAPVAASVAEEAKLAEQAAQFERELEGKGLLVTEDAALLTYLGSLGRQLLPAGSTIPLRVGVIRDPAVNAFALPNGVVYLHAGLLGRLENEAQLAHVLAHEISHIARKHQMAGRRSLRAKTATAKIADIALGGLASPLVALTYAASVNGYGREQEAEADVDALRALAAVGYRPEEAARVFSHFDDEPEGDALETYFFRGHPANAERIAAVHQAIASGKVKSPANAKLAAGDYFHATRAIALRSIDFSLERLLFLKARRDAERQIVARGESARLVYLAAEARRLAAADPDAAAREEAAHTGKTLDDALLAVHRGNVATERKAAAAGYRRALELDPSLRAAHRGLGLVAKADGDRATAASELRLYLESPDPIPDRRSMQRNLNEVSQ